VAEAFPNIISVERVVRDRPPGGRAGVSPPAIQAMRIFQRPVCFIHIPKTGGTAFRHYVESLYRPSEILRIMDLETEQKRLEKQPIGAETSFVSGHFGYGFAKYFSQEPWTICILRHPVGRVLSTYFYWQTVEVGKEKRGVARMLRRVKKMSLADFLEDRVVRPFISNVACASLGQLSDEPFDGVWRPEHTALALTRLKEMDFVGVAERMEESVEQFRRCFGLPAGAPLPEENVTSIRWREEDVDPPLIERILQLNVDDLTLWRAANQGLDENVQSKTPYEAAAVPNALERFHPERFAGGAEYSLGAAPLLGTGWLAREHRDDGRVLALPGPSTIHVAWPCKGASTLFIHLVDVADDVNPARLQVTLDGEACEVRTLQCDQHALLRVRCPPRVENAMATLGIVASAATDRKVSKKSKAAAEGQALLTVSALYWFKAKPTQLQADDHIFDWLDGRLENLAGLARHAASLERETAEQQRYCEALCVALKGKDDELSALQDALKVREQDFKALSSYLAAKEQEILGLQRAIEVKAAENESLSNWMTAQQKTQREIAEYNTALVRAVEAKDAYAAQLQESIRHKESEAAVMQKLLREKDKILKQFTKIVPKA